MRLETKILLRNKAIAFAPRVFERIEEWRFLGYLRQIRRDGYQLPVPGLLKRSILKAEALRIGAKTFVETGTYLGDSVWHFRNSFRRLFSIEVNPTLASAAQHRFRSRPHIAVVQGDSSTMLAGLMPRIEGPTLFFLDGHYSGGITGKAELECPIWKELSCILQAPARDHSILIDDARLFGRDRDYPSLDQLIPFLKMKWPDHTVKVENDLIWVQMPVGIAGNSKNPLDKTRSLATS